MNGTFSWITTGIGDVAFGATGIAYSDSYLYVCAQQNDIILLTDRNRSYNYRCTRITDPHSLVLVDNELFCISSGTNEIVRLISDDTGKIVSEEVIWSVPGVPKDFDSVHLNSLTHDGQQFIVSAFGERTKDQSWSEIDSGFVMSTTDGILLDAIKQPHSLLHSQGKTYFCESLKGTVRQLDSAWEVEVGGYTRGICTFEDQLYVGSSHRRQISKSTGRLLHGRTGDFELADGQCRISQIDTKSGELVREFDLSGYGNEIYEISLCPKEFLQLCDSSDPLLARVRAFEEKASALLSDAEKRVAKSTSEREAAISELTHSLEQQKQACATLEQSAATWKSKCFELRRKRDKLLAKLERLTATMKADKETALAETTRLERDQNELLTVLNEFLNAPLTTRRKHLATLRTLARKKTASAKELQR